MSESAPRSARDHLAIALDVAEFELAQRLVKTLDGVPGWLKVGSELFVAAGLPAVAVVGAHARVFLDLKFHDIPHTVARAVSVATQAGVALMTLHAAGGTAMLHAARAAAAESAERCGLPRPKLVAVTLLTSLAASDLAAIGFRDAAVGDAVDRLVDLALEAGLDGVVASPLEAERIRARVGRDCFLVTPGVRSAGAALDDQNRTLDAAAAIAAGSDLVVVGRPVLRAADPAARARELLREIEAGLAQRRN